MKQTIPLNAALVLVAFIFFQGLGAGFALGFLIWGR